jgi:hypothetical protein
VPGCDPHSRTLVPLGNGNEDGPSFGSHRVAEAGRRLRQ